AELREVDALAGAGEQELADHLVDMSRIAGPRRLLRRRVDPEGEGEVLPRDSHCSTSSAPSFTDTLELLITTEIESPLARVMPELSRVIVLSFGSERVTEP